VADRITFGDLRHLLEECAFQQTPVDGPYVVYKHEGAGALQAFRAHRRSERVDPMTVASVRKTLVEFGFMEEAEFEEAVREAVADRKAKPQQG
jgi:hypothetical protein